MNDSPLILELDQDAYEPGEFLTGRYRIAEDLTDVERQVEIVVYWCSQGKGDEDRAVQFEERRIIPAGEETDSSGGEFSIALPTAPLSYDGVLIKILWFVQILVRRSKGGKLEQQVPFQLGHVAAAVEVPK